MHRPCVLLTFSNGEGALFYILHSPESLSKDLISVYLFCSPNMGVKVYLFSVLMCSTSVGTSVRGLYHSPFTFIWEFSHLDEISPGNSFVIEFSQEAGPSKREDWQPLLQVPRSHPEELKCLNKATLWLLGILAYNQHPYYQHSSLALIILAFIFMVEDWIT